VSRLPLIFLHTGAIDVMMPGPFGRVALKIRESGRKICQLAHHEPLPSRRKGLFTVQNSQMNSTAKPRRYIVKQPLAVSWLAVASVWPKLLILAGFVMFVAAGVRGTRVPVAAILVGPGVMLIGIIVSRLK
jgi:hypothetical protein